MKKHDVIYYTGLAIVVATVLVWALVLGDEVSYQASVAVVVCWGVGALLMTYAQSINPRLHFMYKGSFLRTLLLPVAVGGVGWLLILAVYCIYRLIAGL